jgi:hypothetical protein
MGVIFSSLSVPTLCVSLAHDLDGNAWDAQIERDAADGQLDCMAAQALAELDFKTLPNREGVGTVTNAMINRIREIEGI